MTGALSAWRGRVHSIHAVHVCPVVVRKCKHMCGHEPNPGSACTQLCPDVLEHMALTPPRPNKHARTLPVSQPWHRGAHSHARARPGPLQATLHVSSRPRPSPRMCRTRSAPGSRPSPRSCRCARTHACHGVCARVCLHACLCMCACVLATACAHKCGRACMCTPA